VYSTNHRNNKKCHHFENGVQNNAAVNMDKFVTFWGYTLLANEVKMSNKFVLGKKAVLGSCLYVPG